MQRKGGTTSKTAVASFSGILRCVGLWFGLPTFRDTKPVPSSRARLLDRLTFVPICTKLRPRNIAEMRRPRVTPQRAPETSHSQHGICLLIQLNSSPIHDATVADTAAGFLQRRRHVIPDTVEATSHHENICLVHFSGNNRQRRPKFSEHK